MLNYYLSDLSPQWNKAEKNCKVHKDVLIKPNLTNLYQSSTLAWQRGRKTKIQPGCGCISGDRLGLCAFAVLKLQTVTPQSVSLDIRPVISGLHVDIGLVTM